MGFGVIAIAALGFTTGLLLKLKTFLPVVGLVFVASVVFAILSDFSFGWAALSVLGAQFVLQVFYFVGVTVSVFVARWHRNSHVL